MSDVPSRSQRQDQQGAETFWQGPENLSGSQYWGPQAAEGQGSGSWQSQMYPGYQVAPEAQVSSGAPAANYQVPSGESTVYSVTPSYGYGQPGAYSGYSGYSGYPGSSYGYGYGNGYGPGPDAPQYPSYSGYPSYSQGFPPGSTQWYAQAPIGAIPEAPQPSNTGSNKQSNPNSQPTDGTQLASNKQSSQSSNGSGDGSNSTPQYTVPKISVPEGKLNAVPLAQLDPGKDIGIGAILSAGGMASILAGANISRFGPFGTIGGSVLLGLGVFEIAHGISEFNEKRSQVWIERAKVPNLSDNQSK